MESCRFALRFGSLTKLILLVLGNLLILFLQAALVVFRRFFLLIADRFLVFLRRSKLAIGWFSVFGESVIHSFIIHKQALLVFQMKILEFRKVLSSLNVYLFCWLSLYNSIYCVFHSLWEFVSLEYLFLFYYINEKLFLVRILKKSVSGFCVESFFHNDPRILLPS